MKIKNLLRSLYRMVVRNNYDICGKRIHHKGINLEWWYLKENIGDTLSPIIYSYMLNGKENDINNCKFRHIMTIGSLIGMSDFDSIIWGSGIHTEYTANQIIKNRKLVKYDIRCVRGPISAFLLNAAGYSCPEVYGDPAVLMPLVYDKPQKEEYEVSLIFHLDHKIDVQGINVIDTNTSDYKYFIDNIRKSKKVISSSLHGIILSEAYGVPAVFLLKGMEEEKIKFFDWYYSTERYNIKIANTIDEAVKMEPMPLPDLQKMKNNLIGSFPYDQYK